MAQQTFYPLRETKIVHLLNDNILTNWLSVLIEGVPWLFQLKIPKDLQFIVICVKALVVTANS